jgi:GTP-binding protein
VITEVENAKVPRKSPSVVLVGRPNVGKSTLFNRMTGARRAIVAPVAGTTRDSLARPVSWQNRTFQLSDTGGLYGASEDPLHELVARHGKRAIQSADLLVFLVDGREGLVSGDQEIARELRQTGLPIILALNKIDDKRSQARVGEFYELGFDPVIEISAEHGTGVGDLLDQIVTTLQPTSSPAGADQQATEAEQDFGESPDREPIGSASDDESADSRPDETTVAVVGRPNVGKSSLLNRLLKEERVLVSEMPGTTRDPIDALLTWRRRRFRIVDTAGMRRPGRVRSGGRVELASVAAAKRGIADAHVVVLVIDANEGPTDLDAAIGGEAHDAGRGILIVVNKWDLVKTPGHDEAKTFDAELRRKMKFLDYAPILHVSALTGHRTPKILEVIDKIAEARRQRVPTPALNRFIESVTASNPPASPERRNVRILYAAQTGVAPPSFVLFTNVATTLHFSYERFLVNRLREQFGFLGTPIRVQVRRRAKRR